MLTGERHSVISSVLGFHFSAGVLITHATFVTERGRFEQIQEHRCPHGPLERNTPEEGDLGWLAFVVLAVIGNALGLKSLDPEETGVGESGRVSKILADEFETPGTERVMIQSQELTASSLRCSKR